MGEELDDGEEHEPPARGDGGVDPGADGGDDEEEAPDAYRSARLGSAAEMDALRAAQEAAHRAAYGSDLPDDGGPVLPALLARVLL